MNYIVMMPAAGSGQRMGAGFNKLFLMLGNKPILIHTLEVFENDLACVEILLAVKQEEQSEIQAALNQYGITKVTRLVDGGSERQYSVAACIEAYDGDDIVLVHDAARPFIQQAVIKDLVSTAAKYGASIAGVQAKDTMKLAPLGIVEKTVDRETLWIIQTPQAFQIEVLRKASNQAKEDGFLGTDESMLVERLGYPVRIVQSTYDNVKMTTQEDIVFGEILLKRQRESKLKEDEI
ncbi:2-C-methyl-D-erythritol 4-phosphate cytidylyltransferase [Sporosarcina sp. FA9]|uniref:2-C-methyl-D-erythritol 4-phosphate cytidylyltransferase n=1 Tax=Sporosarcina sp. FA9 TaxID=3413030 RepID=UPI003F65A138